MKALNKKLGKNGGFTLIEMLIVVAIIAILIAISIPLVNNALERARDATDQANERSAKAEALILYLDVATSTEKSALMGDGAVYNALSGKLEPNTDNIENAYGQCRCTGNKVFAGEKKASAAEVKAATIPATVTLQDGKHDGCILYVKCSDAGDVGLYWVTK